MTELDPALITPCGALTATTPDGPGHLSVAARLREQGADIRTLTADAARAGFPMARFSPGETILHQPAAGHFSPRRYVALATQSAQGNGATITPGTVRVLRTSAAGAEAELDDGRRLHAETAIVASGAFAAGSDLLPVPMALRAKSEVYVMAELDDQQAAELDAMPCINRTISHPELADLYVLPPIRYPDGRSYLKFGRRTRRRTSEEPDRRACPVPAGARRAAAGQPRRLCGGIQGKLPAARRLSEPGPGVTSTAYRRTGLTGTFGTC